jgi:hypothetical protein
VKSELVYDRRTGTSSINVSLWNTSNEVLLAPFKAWAVIDEVFIYGRALDGSEIKQLYNSAPVPEPATLLLLASGLVGLAGFRRKKQVAGS